MVRVRGKSGVRVSLKWTSASWYLTKERSKKLNKYVLCYSNPYCHGELLLHCWGLVNVSPTNQSKLRACPVKRWHEIGSCAEMTMLRDRDHRKNPLQADVPLFPESFLSTGNLNNWARFKIFWILISFAHALCRAPMSAAVFKTRNKGFVWLFFDQFEAWRLAWLAPKNDCN